MKPAVMSFKLASKNNHTDTKKNNPDLKQIWRGAGGRTAWMHDDKGVPRYFFIDGSLDPGSTVDTRVPTFETEVTEEGFILTAIENEMLATRETRLNLIHQHLAKEPRTQEVAISLKHLGYIGNYVAQE